MNFDPTAASKNALRTILATLPNESRTDHTRQMIEDLLTQNNIEAIPYTYSCVFAVAGGANAIAAGTSATGYVNIQTDADFLILTQTYAANSLNAAETASSLVVPNCTVFLTDTGSGMNLMDLPVPIASSFGTAQLPRIMQQPRRLAAKATLQVQVANYDAAAGYNLWLNFNGVKLFAYN